ncbi:MAG: VanZ family protein [Acidimicrobiia bacterium]|nr:VanZ family protein [Acidimicrobiia bacterium]
MVLVGVAIVVQGLRSRPGSAEIAVALGVATVYFMVFVRMGIAEERTHLIEYGIVALLIHAALNERALRNPHVPAPAVLAIAIAGSVGVVDELIQALLPNRVFDLRDILFNIVAAVMAVGAIKALQWARQRASN